MSTTLPLTAVTIRAGFQPVMGTHLDLQITADDESEARAAEATALTEAIRLEAAFTVFDPGSELCRWRSGGLGAPSDELADLLTLAASMHHRTIGTVNPLAGALTRRWQQAVADGVVPEADELAELAASIAAPRFATVDGIVIQLGDCAALDLNAVAKGHVVDRVAHQVLADHQVTRLVVNAGGDLVHRGSGSVRVAVEEPARAHDNAMPLTRIEVADAAVATSGRARRWFEVGGHRHSRVLDPRTGLPVSHTASATVVAPDAATADGLATAASVLAPAETMDLLDRLGAEGLTVAALVVAADGTEHRSRGWHELEVGPPAG